MKQYTLHPYQRELLRAAWIAMFRQGHQSVLVRLPTGGGKCLGRGTPVMLSDGRVIPVEEVRAGDWLMGPNGRRRVRSVAQGREELFRVTPTKGDPYVVNRSHILSLRRNAGTAKGDIINLSVEDYLQTNATFKATAKGWRSPVQRFDAEARELPIPPYLLGIWLGDGNSRGTGLTNVDPEVLQAWHAYAHSLGGSVRVADSNGTRCPTHFIRFDEHHANPMQAALRDLNLLLNKHIPLPYRTAHWDDRRELLAGIIDTDGYLHNGGYDLVFKQVALAHDVAFVARSLGLAAYVKTVRKSIKSIGFEGTYYRVSISGDTTIIPCRVPRRQAAPRLAAKDVTNVGITLESIGEGEYFGFELDGPDRLFLLGDFTVTHNTIISAEFIDAVIRLFEWQTMFFAHRREIIHQSAAKLAQADLHPGIIMRGDLYQPSRRVQVASIQSYLSWVNRGKIAVHKPDLIVQDEAHSALGKGNRQVLEAALKDGCKLLGLTATPVNKRGYGLANLYQTMVQGPDTQDLIDLGFLVPVNYYMGIQPDVSGLKILDGDYTEADLNKVMNHEALVGDIVDNWHAHSAGRPTIAFAASVAHSMFLAQQFRNAGLKAVHIDGTTDKKLRDQANLDLATGRIDVLSNYGTHVEGTDIPPIACLIDGCPSASLMRVLQKGGRGFRTSPTTGKTDLNYHDHSGNILRHGRLEMRRTWTLTPGRENIEANELALKSQVIERICPHCGFLFKGAVCLQCHEPYVPQGVEVEIVPAVLAKMTYAELDAYVAKKHKAKQATEAAIGQQKFYLEARGWCDTHGKKDGFAYHAFKDKYGVEPRKEWQQQEPVMFTAQTDSYMRSRLIKAAKGFAKRRLANG